MKKIKISRKCENKITKKDRKERIENEYREKYHEEHGKYPEKDGIYYKVLI